MAENASESAAPRRLASFGRRRGRRLRTTKAGLMETLLPQLLLDMPETGEVNLKDIFAISLQPGGGEGESPYKEYWLEIGFGGGEHLAHQAGLHRGAGIIGCEPYLNGVAGLLKHIQDHRLKNIRIHDNDARMLMERLPDASITRAFILYPDPWPKAKHKKRRLVNAETLDMLARILKPGGELRLATDDEDYCAWMLEHILPHPAFAWQARTSADWLNPPPDWVTTRYEQKKAFNRGLIPSYLNFIRK